MLHCDSEVKHAVVLLLQETAYTRGEIHLLKHDCNHHRHLNGEFVHAKPDGRLRHLQKLAPVVYHDEFPRLGIAGRRSQTGRLQTFDYIIFCDRLRRIFPVALPFQYQFRKIHYKILILPWSTNNRISILYA